ncbi:hypothetical protein GCM10027168_36980 [Streptomyces capparidis]
MVTEARRNGWSVGPCAPRTAPSRPTTAAAAVVTGQLSITRRLSMQATVLAGPPPYGPGPGGEGAGAGGGGCLPAGCLLRVHSN